MDTFYSPFPSKNSRIGFHYFPDTMHYRDADLQTWLPELQAMAAGWLVLKSEPNRAIPEPFLAELLKNQVEPLIQFDLPLTTSVNLSELQLILESYARWGVKGITLFNHPNDRSAWPASIWAQQNLVDHFLDRYLPIAKLADQVGLNPIFPVLQSPGSYWDTAFLKAALEGISRRRLDSLLDHMVLACYGHSRSRSLNWGAGGPQRWAGSRPYYTPDGEEDQNGFRLYEWYQAAAQAVLQREIPILMFQAGCVAEPQPSKSIGCACQHDTFKTVAQLLIGDQAADESGQPFDAIPPYVLCGNFWLLAAESTSPFAGQAWFKFDGATSAIVETLKTLVSLPRFSDKQIGATPVDPAHPIQHYLLLPSFDWGIADWHLDTAKPFIRKYRPTVGFSVAEAALAREVTVIDSSGAFSEEILDQLRISGSLVRKISSIGIEIASELAER